MVVLYVDDVGIAYAHKSDLNSLLTKLEECSLQFTRESTFTDFLGIKFEKDPVKNAITLTQRGLIQKIIDATGMHDCNPNWTPATQITLGIDPDGEPYDESWRYPSIVGKLLYLSTNTRPDITFAVSQVVWFNHSPKRVMLPPSKQLSAICTALPTKAQLSHQPATSPLTATSTPTLQVFTAVIPIMFRQARSQKLDTSSSWEDVPSCGNSNFRLRFPSPLWNPNTPLSAPVWELCFPFALSWLKSSRLSVFLLNSSQKIVVVGALLLATKQQITNRTKYFCHVAFLLEPRFKRQCISTQDRHQRTVCRLPHKRTQPRNLWSYLQACPRLVMSWWAVPLLIFMWLLLHSCTSLTNQIETSLKVDIWKWTNLCFVNLKDWEGELQYSHCYLFHCRMDVPEYCPTDSWVHWYW